jgi:hypothetical protein
MISRGLRKLGKLCAQGAAFGLVSYGTLAFGQAPFTIVTLPDTQNLTDPALFALPVSGLPQALVGNGPGEEGRLANRETLFHAQTHWVSQNRTSQNIQFLAHLGDITQLATVPEFDRADPVFDRLDAIGNDFVYSTVPGNHDYTPGGNGKSATTPSSVALANYDATFGPARYAGKAWYGGASPNSANSYQLFNGGGRTYLHIGLEFNPQNVFNNENSVEWAQSVIDANPGVPTILTTHALIRDSLTPLGGNTGPNAGQDAAGVFLYRNLVRSNDQIFATFNGHYHDLANGIDGERFEVTTNNYGRPVYTLLSDFQDYPNGSDGYMRNYIFDEANDKIHAVTYSPRTSATNLVGTGLARFHEASTTNPFVMPAGLPDVTSGTFQIDADSDFEIAFDFSARLDNLAPPQAAPKGSFTLGGFGENFDSMGDGSIPFTGREAPLGFRVLTLPGNNNTFTNSTGISITPASDPLSSFTYTGFLTVNSTYGGGSPSLATNNNGLNAAFAAALSDRILATSPTGNGAAGIELQLVNNSGVMLSMLDISYDIVRLSAVSNPNELPGYHLFYSLDSGDTWVNVAALDPTLSGPGGVIVPNSIGVTSIVRAPISLNGTWNPGQNLYLRWIDDNADQTSPDQIIGLNNVNIAIPEPSFYCLLAAGLPAAWMLFRRRQQS